MNIREGPAGQDSHEQERNLNQGQWALDLLHDTLKLVGLQDSKSTRLSSLGMTPFTEGSLRLGLALHMKAKLRREEEKTGYVLS